MLTTEDTLLGGRVRYRQPAEGFRSGIEPVLLAASVPARPGERVLEAGTGAGAGLLCLSARVSPIEALGVEIDRGLASLAAENAAANGFGGMRIVAGAIEDTALPGGFDHAMANPPYHLGAGTASPFPIREQAKRGSAAALRDWVSRLAAALRTRGSLTLVVPAAAVPLCLSAMEDAACPCSVVYPLWPKEGRTAKLVLIRGIRLGRSPLRLVPGLVLHGTDGRFTAAAEAVLRDAGGLDLDRTGQPG